MDKFSEHILSLHNRHADKLRIEAMSCPPLLVFDRVTTPQNQSKFSESLPLSPKFTDFVPVLRSGDDSSMLTKAPWTSVVITGGRSDTKRRPHCSAKGKRTHKHTRTLGF
eukprot:g12302.t1